MLAGVPLGLATSSKAGRCNTSPAEKVSPPLEPAISTGEPELGTSWNSLVISTSCRNQWTFDCESMHTSVRNIAGGESVVSITGVDTIPAKGRLPIPPCPFTGTVLFGPQSFQICSLEKIVRPVSAL